VGSRPPRRLDGEPTHPLRERTDSSAPREDRLIRCTPVANPPNPFESRHAEWLGPPPIARLEVFHDHSRSILSRNDSPDLPFRWSVNPYRGCQHACAYCYARPNHEYLGFGAGTDFDTRIVVKEDAPQLLRKALFSRRWKRELICFSGVTDCYQPLEATYEITRRCLEVCVEAANPVGIVTKGFLVVRDIDVLTRLQRRASVSVYVSIPFARQAAAAAIEPVAPPPDRRFEALTRLSAAGIPTGVMVSPIIPGLNDRDVPEILTRAARAGARWASYTALRLPGNVAAVFLDRLKAAMPTVAGRVEALVRGMRSGELSDSRFGHRMRGSGAHWKAVEALFELHARRNGLNAQEADSEPCGTPPRASESQLALFDLG